MAKRKLTDPKINYGVTETRKRKFKGRITLEEIQEAFYLPKDAIVSVMVPGGGDWSSTELVLGTDVPHIDVYWEEIK